MIALVAAVLAGVLIYLFVNHFAKTKVAPPATATVFVAKSYISAGTPDTSIVSQGTLKAKVVPLSQVVIGAITDPSVISGEYASVSIAAGQQITAADFTRAPSSLSSYLTGDQRAVAIDIDAAHGLTSYLKQDSTVDVIAQAAKGNASTTLFQNVTILANTGGIVVLRLTDEQTLRLANAKQTNLTLWLTLRPATGAKDSVRIRQIVGGI
ncbi:MAG: Flp pilus assembly protein CpaB [Pseudonocardiaceae bacterium]